MEPLSIEAPALTRRQWLRVGLGLGTSLVFGSPASVYANPSARPGARRKSLVVLWLSGGPSQLETWDPHPRLMAQNHGPGLATRVEGLRIARFFPQTAELIHNLSVIRSLVSKEGDHERATHYLKTGYRPDPTATHPALTAVVAQQRAPVPLEIPTHVSLGAGLWPAWGGYLGPTYDAFKVFEPGRNVGNLQARVSAPERHQRREQGLAVVEAAFRRGRGRCRRPDPAPADRRARSSHDALRRRHRFSARRRAHRGPHPLRRPSVWTRLPRRPPSGGAWSARRRGRAVRVRRPRRLPRGPIATRRGSSIRPFPL